MGSAGFSRHVADARLCGRHGRLSLPDRHVVEGFRRSRSGHDRTTDPSVVEARGSGGPARPVPAIAQHSQGRLRPADRQERRRHRRPDLRADVRRTVPILRDLPQPRKENPRTGRPKSQMQVPLPLLDRPAVRLHVGTGSNLVSLFHPSVHERSGMACSPHGRERHGLHALRQQLPVDRGFSQSPKDVRRHAQDGLAQDARRRRPPSASGPCRACFAGWDSITIGRPSKPSGPPTRSSILRKPWPPSIRNWFAAPSPPSTAARSCASSAIGSTKTTKARSRAITAAARKACA